MDDYRTFRLTAIEPSLSPCWGEGIPGRPMLLGFAAAKGETLPFTVGSQMYLRAALDRIGVSPKLVYFNYLFKLPPGEDDLYNPVFISRHVAIVQKEIERWMRPKAVVLFGLRTFNHLFGRTDKDIDTLRKTRFFNEKMPDINFFVTYDPADVIRSEEAGDIGIGQDWYADLNAIFQTNQGYFKTRRLMGDI